MAALLAKLASPILRLVIVLALVAALGLATAAIYRSGALSYERIILDRVASTVAERNAFWEGRIEAANAATERRAAEQVKNALQIQAEAVEKVRTAEQQLAELKVVNEGLPIDYTCGLGRERGRLLPR